MPRINKESIKNWFDSAGTLDEYADILDEVIETIDTAAKLFNIYNLRGSHLALNQLREDIGMNASTSNTSVLETIAKLSGADSKLDRMARNRGWILTHPKSRTILKLDASYGIVQLTYS